jgi:hypothetical protein
LSSRVDRDLEEFRRFLLRGLFRMGVYRSFEGSMPVYCVGLLVKCAEPDGWVVVWRRCYDNAEEAMKLLGGVELISKNRLGDLLYVVDVEL